jgi:hypothetical protein
VTWLVPLNRRHMIKHQGDVIFQEIRDVLDLHFNVYGVCHVPRFCNQCAHELARSDLARDPDIPNPLPSFGGS